MGSQEGFDIGGYSLSHDFDAEYTGLQFGIPPDLGEVMPIGWLGENTTATGVIQGW